MATGTSGVAVSSQRWPIKQEDERAGAATVAHRNALRYLTPQDPAGRQDLPVFFCELFGFAFFKGKGKMRQVAVVLALLVTLLGSAACTNTPATAGPRSPTKPLIALNGKTIGVAEMEASIRQAMAKANMAGLSVAILNDKQIAYVQALGYRDQARGIPFNTQTVTAAASLSKTVFAYLVMLLTEDGTIDLETLARQKVFEPLGMTHTSGVWRRAPQGNMADGNMADPHDVFGRPQRLAQFRGRHNRADAAGSMVTTAEDYARLLAAIMNASGQRQATMDEMLRPQIAISSEQMFGPGAWVDTN